LHAVPAPAETPTSPARAQRADHVSISADVTPPSRRFSLTFSVDSVPRVGVNVPHSMSRKICRLLVVLGVFTARAAFARCGDLPGDSMAVADIRARAEMQCDCATAFSHNVYVHCVRAVANTAVERGELSPQRRSAVTKCASKSTRGRPGAAVCGRPPAEG